MTVSGNTVTLEVQFKKDNVVVNDLPLNAQVSIKLKDENEKSKHIIDFSDNALVNVSASRVFN
ncbi:hypothetical protein D3C78_1434000 [compost metagenome]